MRVLASTVNIRTLVASLGDQRIRSVVLLNQLSMQYGEVGLYLGKSCGLLPACASQSLYQSELGLESPKSAGVRHVHVAAAPQNSAVVRHSLADVP